DRLGKHGKARRGSRLGPGHQTLALGDRDLVVNPPMIGVPKPGVAIFGGNVHAGRTGGVFEILQAPRVGFTDRHGAKVSASAERATAQLDDSSLSLDLTFLEGLAAMLVGTSNPSH